MKRYKMIDIQTRLQDEMIDITTGVRAAVAESGVTDGLCVVYVPHTTACVTINENADPDVPRDILAALDRAVPRQAGYRHAEGNSAAHVKSSLIGSSVTVLIENGRLILGTWQSVFFCEFDGPRSRQVIVKVI